MKLLSYIDERNQSKHYVNVSKAQYEAVLYDLLEKTRIKLVKSKQSWFYQLKPSYQRLQKAYEYLLQIL